MNQLYCTNIAKTTRGFRAEEPASSNGRCSFCFIYIDPQSPVCGRGWSNYIPDLISYKNIFTSFHLNSRNRLFTFINYNYISSSYTVVPWRCSRRSILFKFQKEYYILSHHSIIVCVLICIYFYKLI